MITQKGNAGFREIILGLFVRLFMQLCSYSRPQAWMDQSILVPLSLTCLDSEYQPASR